MISALSACLESTAHEQVICVPDIVVNNIVKFLSDDIWSTDSSFDPVLLSMIRNVVDWVVV